MYMGASGSDKSTCMNILGCLYTPTAGEYFFQGVEIMQLLASLNRDQGINIVMVTHEPDMAAYAKRIVHFKDSLIDNDHANQEHAV